MGMHGQGSIRRRLLMEKGELRLEKRDIGIRILSMKISYFRSHQYRILLMKIR